VTGSPVGEEVNRSVVTSRISLILGGKKDAISITATVKRGSDRRILQKPSRMKEKLTRSIHPEEKLLVV